MVAQQFPNFENSLLTSAPFIVTMASPRSYPQRHLLAHLDYNGLDMKRRQTWFPVLYEGEKAGRDMSYSGGEFASLPRLSLIKVYYD
jgi:hypothetical protein